MRNLERPTTVVLKDDTKIGKRRGRKTGTREDNIVELKGMIQVENSVKRAAKLKSIVAVAKELMSCMVLGTMKLSTFTGSTKTLI